VLPGNVPAQEVIQRRQYDAAEYLPAIAGPSQRRERGCRRAQTAARSAAQLTSDAAIAVMVSNIRVSFS